MKELLRMVDVSADSPDDVSLQHCYLHVHAGQIVALAGLRDSGKRTIWQLLRGDLPLGGGRLWINGSVYAAPHRLRTMQERVFSIEPDYQFVKTLTVYENLSLGRGQSSLRLFDRREAIKRTQHLLAQYDLDIDPTTPVWRLSDTDFILLSLLKAVYSGARLAVIDVTGWHIPYAKERMVQKMLLKMRSFGMSFLMECDTANDIPRVADRIDLMRQGRIVKSFEHSSFDAMCMEQIMLLSESQPRAMPGSPCAASIVGIFELFERRCGLQQYWGSLHFLLPRGSERDACVLDIQQLDALCANLSIGENMALTRYPALCGPLGVVDHSISAFLESEFNRLLIRCGSRPRRDIPSLSAAERRILTIERRVMAKSRILVLEEPTARLDTSECLLMKRFFMDLSRRGVRLYLIAYNITDLQNFCDEVYLCEHGRRLNQAFSAEPHVLNREIARLADAQAGNI